MVDNLTSIVKQEATRLGFDTVGIADVEVLEKEGALLKEWLTRGYQGEMAYMARNIEKRIDVREIMPDAKSVIVGAVNYYTPFQHSDEAGTGKISRYAWGTDYHEIIPPKLQALLEFIQAKHPGAEGRYYVDTGPVLEKAWAVRAGIGWMGKHTNVLSRERGSWFFLGVLIVNVALEHDAPIEDFCGSCTACIDACPTQAITEPYVLDASRCISYLTIELKPDEQIPAEHAKHLDNWIFGCDVCQDVCPWNSFLSPTSEEQFAPRENNISPKLEDILSMTQEEFSRRFRKSPIKRTKLAGLTRNARAIISPSPREAGRGLG